MFSSIKRNQNDGIIIFVKQHLSADFFDYNLLDYNIVKLSFNLNKMPFSILCIYRSPSTDYTGFINSLRDVLNNLNLNAGIITLIGDVNINIIGTNTNNYDYLDLLSELGFTSFINVHTRLPQGQQHSCLDYVFIKDNNSSFKYIKAGVLQTEITDHCSIVVTIPVTTKPKIIKNFLKVINYDKLRFILSKEKWKNVFNSNSVNFCLSDFQKSIINAINESSSTKYVNFKNKTLKEWMTKGLLCSARRKQYLSLKCKKNPNNVELNSYFKKYKNNFTKLIKLAKINYYTGKFTSVSSNPKLTWKLINELTSRNLKNKNSIDFININDQPLNVEDNTEEAANYFNTFFVNVTEKLAGNFNKLPKVQMIHNKTCLFSFDDIF